MVLRLTPAQLRKLTGQPAPRRVRAHQRRAVRVPAGAVWPLVERSDGSVAFWFPSPGRPPSANDRGHWSNHSGTIAEWRALTETFARRVRFERDTPSFVTVLVPSAVRDAANLSVPCAKAMIDGLVDAGWWPDDDTRRVHACQPVVLPVSIGMVGVAVTPTAAGIDAAYRFAVKAAGWAVSASTAA